MKNTTKPSALSKARRLLMMTTILLLSLSTSYAQIPPNAVNADPAARAISQFPLGSNIIGNAVLRFRFANEATSTNNTGQIPPNSVRLTLSFPGVYAYTSISNIPKFIVEDAETNPFGVVHLVNNALILEGEIIDLELNVRAVSNGSGTVTFNADRVAPITVANILTGNDNSSATFIASVTLPVSLVDFNVQKTNCTAKLSWLTTGETNIESYIVEVSNNNGLDYTSVGTVSSANATGQNNYSFTHQMSNKNPHLYRIKIVETNGKISYSDIGRINSGCADTKSHVFLYPSPATTDITLTVSGNAEINTMASIIDATGRIHQSFLMNANTKKLNVAKLPAGMYIIRFRDGASAKFIKQ